MAAISKVAQSREYYSPETERILASDVESPANQAIEKLLKGKDLRNSERLSVSNYIATMLKRGPRRRQKADEIYPQVLAETVEELRAKIRELASRRCGINPQLADRRLAECDAVEEKFRVEKPSSVTDEVKRPWASKEMLGAIHRMAWRIVESRGPQSFITSDTPVFFFEGFGLLGKEAELCFPLSSTRALHGCWQGREGSLTFLVAAQQLVKEINRRLASTTIRFAFYHERAPWLPPLLAKKHPYLSAVKWRVDRA